MEKVKTCTRVQYTHYNQLDSHNEEKTMTYGTRLLVTQLGYSKAISFNLYSSKLQDLYNMKVKFELRNIVSAIERLYHT